MALIVSRRSTPSIPIPLSHSFSVLDESIVFCCCSFVFCCCSFVFCCCSFRELLFWFLSLSFSLSCLLICTLFEIAGSVGLFCISFFSASFFLCDLTSPFTIAIRLIFLVDLLASSLTLLRKVFVCSLEKFNSESLRTFSISSFSEIEIFIFGAVEKTLSIVSLISIFFWFFWISVGWWSFTLSFSAPILFS